MSESEVRAAAKTQGYSDKQIDAVIQKKFGNKWAKIAKNSEQDKFDIAAGLQSATLALVAPGIAEALVATAMGLFAAIPAVVAYNRYADKVARLEVRYDGFTEEFTNILQRHGRQRSKK